MAEFLRAPAKGAAEDCGTAMLFKTLTLAYKAIRCVHAIIQESSGALFRADGCIGCATSHQGRKQLSSGPRSC